jgi:hypothetical protein
MIYLILLILAATYYLLPARLNHRNHINHELIKVKRIGSASPASPTLIYLLTYLFLLG